MPSLQSALQHAQPACKAGSSPFHLLVLLAFIALCFLLNVWGFIWAFVLSYADGSFGNHYSAIWICGISLVLSIQAVVVRLNPQATTARRARFYAWVWFCTWMWCAGLIILIGLGIALPEQSGWAVFWLVIPPIILFCSVLHHRHAAPPQIPAVTADIETTTGPQQQQQQQQQNSAIAGKGATPPAPAKAPCCSGRAWRNCCSGFVSCLAWSSLFWLSVLAFFLALQAAWLASDAKAYPPPGQMVDVPIDLRHGGTGEGQHNAWVHVQGEPWMHGEAGGNWDACGSQGGDCMLWMHVCMPCYIMLCGRLCIHAGSQLC